MSRWLVLVLLALAVPAVAADPAPTAQAPSKLSERIRGDWTIVLSAPEQRSLDLMAFALSEPVPTDEQITAKGLTSDETMMVAMIVELRRKAPADPQLVEMRKVVADLPNTTLSITADQLTFGLAGQTSSGAYEVVEETADQVKIRHHPPDAAAKEAILRFEGDLLVVADGDRSAIRFKRR